MTDLTFEAWPKTPRLNRDITITEKIDGTNAAIIIENLGVYTGNDWPVAVPGELGKTRIVDPENSSGYSDEVYRIGAQSRTRLLSHQADNFGFARWVADHASPIITQLGEGRHFGEWWGHGIQRGYGMAKGERTFSLFNTHRHAGVELDLIDPLGKDGWVTTHLTTVPVLSHWPTFDSKVIEDVLWYLDRDGSRAAPGYDKPEGVVVFHTAANRTFKVLLEGDDKPKGA